MEIGAKYIKKIGIPTQEYSMNLMTEKYHFPNLRKRTIAQLQNTPVMNFQ